MTFTLTASSLDFPSYLNHTARDAVGAVLLVRYTRVVLVLNHHAVKAYGGSGGINL